MFLFISFFYKLNLYNFFVIHYFFVDSEEMSLLTDFFSTLSLSGHFS